MKRSKLMLYDVGEILVKQATPVDVLKPEYKIKLLCASFQKDVGLIKL